MKNLKLLWNYMQGNRALYLGAIICVALATFFSILNPLIIRITIDSVIGDQPLETFDWLTRLIERFGGIKAFVHRLWLIGLILITFTLIRGFFHYLKGKWSATAAETIAQSLRQKLYDHLQHLPYEYYIKAETGDLIQRCTSDVDQIRQFLAVQLTEVGRAVFMVLSLAIIMFNLNGRLALIAMSMIPVILGFSYFFYKRVKKSFKDADEAEGKMSTVLQENLTGVRIVRAFARQNYEIEKFDQKSMKYKNRLYRVLFWLAWFWSLSDLLSMLQIAAVLVVGSLWAAQGYLTLGTLVAFTTYEGMLLWPVRQLGRILTDWGKTLVALERIQYILDEPIEIVQKNEDRPEITGELTFNQVSFGYSDGRKILKDISFQVNPGETVAILGPTGSGKSTLVHLLTRLYDYQSGSIKIGQHELVNIEKKWLRKHIGLVLQEPFLFARSIKENIGLAMPESKDQEIVEAARFASIHDVILNFDHGYDTLVGERGVSLSGGQKQRVAIARTLIRECPILIFDDSLSAVDTETDAAIRKSLKEKSRYATTFIISHRINTLAEADKIIVLEEGQITHIGTHQELLKKPGLYRRVWELQNSLTDKLLVGGEVNHERI